MSNAAVTKELQVVRGEIVLSTTPVLLRAVELEVVDSRSYAVADNLLSVIRKARKTWADRTSKITAPLKEAMTQLKVSMAEAKSFVEEVDSPLAQGEQVLRDSMRQYKLEEARLIEEERRKEQAEKDRLWREAEEKRIKAEQAKTPQMASRLANQAAKLEVAASTVAAPVQVPVKVQGSGTRTVRAWRVVDMQALLRGVLDGTVPPDVIKLDTPLVNGLHRLQPARVESWPGLEGFDNIQIVGSRL